MAPWTIADIPPQNGKFAIVSSLAGKNNADAEVVIDATGVYGVAPNAPKLE